MSLGSMARAVLGDRWFPVVGRYYRALFVDLEKVIDSFPAPAPGAAVLDIGGGDGELINVFLARHPEARVTMIDLKPQLGGAIRADLRSRVEILAGTSIRDLVTRAAGPFEMIILSDVIHHIPAAARPAFFRDLGDLVGARAATIVIKDIDPGSFRSTMSYLADRYISGDRNVQLTGQSEMVELVRATFPAAVARPTRLVEVDAPNYCLVFAIPAGDSPRS
jgi:2-polyprenyl-3-methyl-5-hydroxy-6-metoxy-1,4-benzoquinol methylase